jgi:hypothetical protein
LVSHVKGGTGSDVFENTVFSESESENEKRVKKTVYRGVS